jgi:hypothetical protein
MQVLHLTWILSSDTLDAARHVHGPPTCPGTFNHYIFGYVGSCQYYFKFSANNTDPKQWHGTLGHLLNRIEEIPWGTNLAVNGFNDWTMIQCEDALIGGGVSGVIRLMKGPDRSR